MRNNEAARPFITFEIHNDSRNKKKEKRKKTRTRPRASYMCIKHRGRDSVRNASGKVIEVSVDFSKLSKNIIAMFASIISLRLLVEH